MPTCILLYILHYKEFAVKFDVTFYIICCELDAYARVALPPFSSTWLLKIRFGAGAGGLLNYKQNCLSAY